MYAADTSAPSALTVGMTDEYVAAPAQLQDLLDLQDLQYLHRHVDNSVTMIVKPLASMNQIFYIRRRVSYSHEDA